MRMGPKADSGWLMWLVFVCGWSAYRIEQIDDRDRTVEGAMTKHEVSPHGLHMHTQFRIPSKRTSSLSSSER